MAFKVVELKSGILSNIFLHDESVDDRISFSDFINSIGLQRYMVSVTTSHYQYLIIDDHKWFLAKIRYGI